MRIKTNRENIMDNYKKYNLNEYKEYLPKDILFSYDKSNHIKNISMSFNEFLKMLKKIKKTKSEKEEYSSKEIDHMIFNKGLKELVEDHNWTITRIAKHIGISQSYLSKISKKINSISVRTLEKYNQKIDNIYEEFGYNEIYEK